MTTLTANYSFAFNNQIFGGANSPYQILSVDGLESLPSIRNEDDNRGYADGMFTGRDFLGGRTISIIFNTFGTSGTSAQANYNIIQSVLLPQQQGTTPLYFKLPNQLTSEQYINARVRALRTTIDPNYTYGYITSQVEFFCPDPKYYNNNTQTLLLATTPATGRVYDRVYPLTYGGGSGYIQGTVTNYGWATTYPTIVLNGPITNPTLGNLTTGESLNFNCVLSSTDYLTVDLYNKLLTLNGVSARNLLAGGTWFGAPAGSTIFYLNGLYTLANVTKAVVTWNSAYI